MPYSHTHFLVIGFNTCILITGSFALADLGMCEPPSSSNVYCSDMSLLQDRYALSAGSDADSDPEGVMTPERAVQLWSGQPLKSRRSSCLSSPDHSVLTLTDSENEHKTDEESGRIARKTLNEETNEKTLMIADLSEG